MEDSASNEAPKRWGFRRSTLARREFMEEIGNLDRDTLVPRRVAQQPRGRGRGRARGKQAGEGLPAASRRGRGRRRAGPDDSGPSTELHSEVFCAPLQPHLLQRTKSDVEASDSDELTLRELQERVWKQRRLQANSAGGRSASDLNPDVVSKANQEAELLSEELKLQEGASMSSSHPTHTASKSSAVLTKDRTSARKMREEEDEDDAGSDFGEDSDPNAVYCICRQAHNKRFMICCDRCQEWFHGDCVGISEARGLLLEKNGEDYICPACSPCPSPVGFVTQPALCKAALSSSSESLFSSSAGEERPSEDEAIKGKIRKASSHSSKRKIKFFQPVEVVSEAVELGLKDHKPTEDAVTVEKVKERAAGPKCIGPGCSNDALPESVYCGHQCIIRHAAVAMQSLSEPKPQPEIKARPAAKPVLKIQNLGKLFRKKLVEKPANQENDGRKEKDLKPSAGTIAAPDHKAQVEEQPAAIAPSVFYRTSMYHPGATAHTNCSLIHTHTHHTVTPIQVSSTHTHTHTHTHNLSLLGVTGKCIVPWLYFFSCSYEIKKRRHHTKCIKPPASLAQSEEPKTEKPLEPKALSALPGETVITQPSGSAFQSKGPSVQKTTGPSAYLALLKEPTTEHPTPLASSATSKGPVAEKPMIALASSQSMNLIAKKPITTLVSSDSLMTQKTPLIPSDLSTSLELKMPKKPLTPPEGRVADKPIKPNTSSAQLESPVAEKTAVTVSPSAPSLKNPLPSRAKKTMPGSPRLTGPKLLLTTAPQENKNSSAVSKNPGQPPEASKTPQMPHPAPEPRVLPVSPAPVPPSRPLQAHPNMQIRQNIRRSLTETLLKRVSDSDDLDAPESKLEKLAVNIEREMFNMYYTTDNKYKTKFRSLLLSLKDPKNKGLLYQVVRGHITPFKLTRLSQEELLSVQACAANPLPVKEDVPPADSDVKEPPKACENRVVKADSVATSSSEDKVQPSVGRPAQPKKVSSAVSDIISSMLKDTTDEHKLHLFDLKCRICTGQISGAEDPEAKRFKKEEPKQEEEEGKAPCVVPIPDKQPPPGTLIADSVIVESPASPTTEDCSTETALPVFTPPVIPAISIVTITRRDPRTAAYRSISSASTVPTESTSATAPSPVSVATPTPTPAVNPPQSVLTKPKPKPSDKENKEETKAPEPRPPPPPVLKSILLKPSASTVPRIYDSSTSTTRLVSSHSPADSETKQETVWKGFLNMQSVAKFVTKGYAISGSSETLKKDMPDTIHIGGRILPQTVWEYVERVKTSVTKMSLIRFCPGTDEEEIAYVSLFSYFNSRRRFGVVSNVCNNVKDLYLIPLGANQSIPSILLPLEGPGLEQNHPNLLIGLAICQKLKRPGLPSQEIDDKRPKIHMPQEPQDSTPRIKAAVPGVKDNVPYDPAIPFFSAPSGSPASLKAPDTFSSSLDSLPGSLDKVKGTSSTTPLQTILKTLFGNSKQGSDSTVNTCEPSSAAVKGRLVPPVPMVDPIVQQYQQSSKTILTEDFNNDRPYDPEEEYDPALEYQNLTPLKPDEILKPEMQTVPAQVDDDRPYDPEEEYNLGNRIDAVITNKSSETEPARSTSAPKDDVAYDPEDETVFEEVQNYLSDHESATAKHEGTATPSLSEQQKMLEELNRQIEEQKRLLAEQEEALRLQRAAVGVSMAHFSVSDALMSPPPSFGREPMETTESTMVQDINSSRDPRQYRTLSQNTECNKNEAPTQSSLLSKTDQENASVKLDKGSKDTDQTNLHSEVSSKTSNRRSHSPSRSSSRSRRSDTSRRERHSSSERRSRHDRSSYDRRTSYDSRDDRRHRGSRRSPESSSRRSRSRSHSRSRSSRQERSSSRQRGQRRRGDTSRRRSSRDRHDSPRSRSSRTRTSARPEKGEDKEEQSASRQSTESAQRGSEATRSANLVTSEKPRTQQDESQSEASENTEQTKCIPKPETDQSDTREEPSSVVSSLTSESNTLQIDTSSQEASSQRGDVPPNETNLTHQTNDQSLDPLQEKGSLSSHESEDKSHQPLQIQIDDFSESEKFYTRDYQEDLPKRPTRLDIEDSPAPEIKTPSINDNPPKILLQNQNDTFREVETDHFSYQNLPQLDAHSVARPELLHRNDSEMIPGNFNPRDQFRPRASDLQRRGPRHSMDGPRCRTPLQPRMLRAPYHERFESCGSNYAGPRPQRQRLSVNPGPSSDFGPGEDCPGVPRHRPYDDFEMSASNFNPREKSSGPEMFKGSGPQNFGPRVPGPDPKRFDGSSRHPSGPKGRIQRPGMFEDSGPHGFRQRGTSSDPGMFDGPYDFPGPPQRRVDDTDAQLPDFNDSREFNAPHQLDAEPFSDFNHPREQWFDDQMFDSRESQPSDLNDLREYSRTPPFDALESDNRGFEESRFSNLPSHHVRRQNPRCESPLHNQPEESQFFKTESEIEGPNQCYTERSRDIFKGGRIDARMQCSRFNPPQNFRGQRVPSPHFHGQRMPAPQSKELAKPCPSNLPSLMKFNVRQRPCSPIAGESQNLIRFDGPSEKPDIRPLRLSGPLLPTPPGGPLRFNNPRMARPSPYDRPQGPSARGHMNEEVKPGCFDDNSNTRTGETLHSLIPDEENEEYGDDGEEYSGQEDSSPGKPWQSRPKRRRRRRRRQRFRSCSDERNSNQGPGERGRNREVTRNADRNRH
ncbi:death-inducer obliterator 1 [Trichomycterus rosablanca]|uniref:death-inducer obliterator 1 n=1 Tax=Trichomycterus rosablanca TaxID=2290929 RepID=UPI002F35A918